ncbi:MAG: Rieske 2Fe-2S domain-containing protein [Christensenellales bacterium]
MITKKISGTKNIYAPDRNNFFASIIQTVKNLDVDIAGWGENLISFDNKKIARIKKGQGATVKIKGKRVGIYRDKNNKLHCVSATCTHLGCALKWNKDETSFDCPCHGSRFNTSGKVLNNPAFENLKKIDLEN